MKPIDFKKTTYSISDFISWQRAGSLTLSPHFQRRQIWQPGAKSLLIDTIVRGLPIPIIILREQKSDLRSLEPRREVVDGQQRLRTIISFIDPKLLKDFNEKNDAFVVKKAHNKEISGKDYKDLGETIQQRILDYEFSVHVLPSQTDDREVIQMFYRLNSTGYRLRPQELRNSQFFGLFKTAMYDTSASHLYRWREWRIFSDYDIARMQEVELVSEFAIIVISGLQARVQKNLDLIYEKHDEVFDEMDETIRRLNIVLDSIDNSFREFIPNSPFKNKSLFHILFAVIYDIHFGIGSSLDKRLRPKPLSIDVVNNVMRIGEDIANKDLPPKEMAIVTARQKNKEYITALFKYFKRELLRA